MLNRNFKDFKFQHSRNKNQIIYTSQKVQNDQEVLNLINNFLREKNSFIKGIRDLKQSQLAVLASIILVIFTKTIDGAERKFGIDLSPPGERFALIVEEVGEMGIPIMFSIAILSCLKKT